MLWFLKVTNTEFHFKWKVEMKLPQDYRGSIQIASKYQGISLKGKDVLGCYFHKDTSLKCYQSELLRKTLVRHCPWTIVSLLMWSLLPCRELENKACFTLSRIYDMKNSNSVFIFLTTRTKTNNSWKPLQIQPTMFLF